VQLLEPTRYRSEHVLFWNRLPVQSSVLMKYRRYWFGAPALPLALASAVRFFLTGVCRRRLSHRSTPLVELGPSSRVLPSYTYPFRRSGSGPLMGFASLQHMRHRKSTCRGFACPLRSAFRVWLPSWRLTPCDPLPVLFRTGSAHGIHPSEVSPLGRYPERYHPDEPAYRSTRRCSRRRSVGPARQASVSGF